MFEKLVRPKADPIFERATEFIKDIRKDKIDLSVGVFRDPSGRTPVMQAVRVAQERVVSEEQTKTYAGLSGFADFNATMLELLFASAGKDNKSLVSLQTPGGAGAVRLLCELVKIVSPDATVWISGQTWAPHYTIMDAVGFKWRSYRYYDENAGGVDLDGMLKDLRQARRGDVVLLHGCCHNPTGVDLSAEQWSEVATVLSGNGLLPLVDMAYQGLGDGLDEDAAGIRQLVNQVPQLLLAASCSKNFGVYRDRAGCAVAFARDPQIASVMRENMVLLARGNYSMPPHHGALIVTTVLADPQLRAMWQSELAGMREQIKSARAQLANAIGVNLGTDRFHYFTGQKGMFSLLPLSNEDCNRLKDHYGIFVTPDGRLNMAGLSANNVERVGRALSEILATKRG